MMKARRKLKSAYSLALSTLLLASWCATSNASEQHFSLQPLSSPQPIYPYEGRRDRVEGWVQVSFVVNEQGNVIDPIIHDSTGYPGFEASALKSLESWRYKPTFEEGQSKEKSLSKVQINFRLEPVDTFENVKNPEHVESRFLSAFRRGFKAIEDGKMKKAAEKIEQLQRRRTASWLENSYSWVLQGYYHEKMNDPAKAAHYFSKVAANGPHMLKQSLYIESLKKLFTAYVMTNKMAEAQEAFNALKQYAPEHAAVKQLTPYYQQVVAMANGSEPFEVYGQLDDSGMWYHTLSRRRLALAGETKGLANLELRCDHKRMKLAQQEKEFELPKDWGQCSLYVQGEKGSLVTLIES